MVFEIIRCLIIALTKNERDMIEESDHDYYYLLSFISLFQKTSSIIVYALLVIFTRPIDEQRTKDFQFTRHFLLISLPVKRKIE